MVVRSSGKVSDMAAPAAPFSPAAARRATLFALTVVFLDVVGFGLLIPVVPRLIEEIGGIGLDDAARVGGWLFAVYSLLQFLCAPLAGALLGQMADYARAQQLGRVWLHASDEGRPLYERIGFVANPAYLEWPVTG